MILLYLHLRISFYEILNIEFEIIENRKKWHYLCVKVSCKWTVKFLRLINDQWVKIIKCYLDVNLPYCYLFKCFFIICLETSLTLSCSYYLVINHKYCEHKLWCKLKAVCGNQQLINTVWFLVSQINLLLILFSQQTTPSSLEGKDRFRKKVLKMWNKKTNFKWDFLNRVY